MLSTLDVTVVALYAVALFAIAQWVSREKAGHEKDASDYFLAGKALPWWAIGASLIAANISAEQIIGMSGSGYAMGLAIASYEWMAAVTLLVVGKYLLPIFLKRGIYTMPQFLEQRYDHSVRMVMAFFWLAVYIFVNLTSILWLGALAISSVAGVDLVTGLVVLGLFAAAYSFYGGLKAVAFTDIIQVVLLVFGGLVIAYIMLDQISGGAGVASGFNTLLERAPEKFDMVFEKGHPFYDALPGISVIVGGMWIMNLSYWGFNQYIIQRALAAKSLPEAQKGIAFAAFLKILMPVIVVLPGIAIGVLSTEPLSAPDQAYPEAMKLLPTGLLGLVFAALIAAIVSSLGSMTNSISTIFTMDIYPSFVKEENRKNPVVVGRFVAVVSMLIAIVIAKPLLGNFDQAFQYIQEFTGFFTPGIVVIFFLGMFWKKTTAKGALAAAVGSFVLSLAFKLYWPELPFIDRVGVVFLICAALAVAISLVQKGGDQEGAVELNDIQFSTTAGFNIASIIVVAIIATLYTIWW
ncbi:sodium/sugar symporter [Kordiimonas sp. SCSIO 12603]|uniref:sodium/sugar symporter n=1 Tax=Kordiimonas sp. SCSIO 12603 TaxID=2829596 RepID=UPI002107F7CF|nr:sodium/sugar symporter [Kordiimonas sp. SCSIO 12603]UTW59552.1 sodium/sugar symporter [Kordiimonas sp. SCSIO 12603]